MAVKQAGQIVLFRFPQTDLVVGKTRPALLLAPLPSGYNDWLVCMISSQTRQTVSGIDEAIFSSDSDFSQSGLKNDSIIRLTRLAVASDSIFSAQPAKFLPHVWKNLKISWHTGLKQVKEKQFVNHFKKS